jgi:hypothetical protein
MSRQARGVGEDFSFATDPASSSSSNGIPTTEPTKNKNGTESYNGVNFDPSDWKTLFMGMVSGL